MKQALIFAEEITRKQEAMRKTKSPMLKRDYEKSVKRDLGELREYCRAKRLDFDDIVNMAEYQRQLGEVSQ